MGTQLFLTVGGRQRWGDGEPDRRRREEEGKAKERNFFFLKGERDKVITTFISPRLCSQVGAHRTGTLEN